MWATIKRWFAPPVFADENKTRSARLLYTILLLLSLGVIIFIPFVYLYLPQTEGQTSDPFFIIVGLTVLIISGSLLLISRRGHVRIANLIITFTIFLGAFAAVYRSGSLSRVEMSILIVVVALAGALLGGRWVIFFIGASLVATLYLGYLQTQNLLPPTLQADLVADTSLYIVVIILVGLLLRYAMNSLNDALSRLGESNFQLKSLSASLEERVAARTLDITLAAEIGRRLTQQREVEQLLNETVNLIQSNFNLYHVQVYLTNAAGDRLILRAGTSQAGTELRQQNHQLSIGPGSINGIAALEKRPLVVPNVFENPLFRPNTLLPETRCEMAIPLLIRDRLIGTLNLQGSHINELTTENLPAFETLGGQIATALDNATLFAQIRQSQTLLEEQARRLARESWQEYLNAIDREERLGYTYSLQGTKPELTEALQTVRNSLVVTQIKVLDEPIGTIQIENAPNQSWDSENRDVVQAVADLVAQQVENLRLLDQAEKFRLEAEEAVRRFTREGWAAYQETAEIPTFLYDSNQVHSLEGKNTSQTSALTLPLQIHGETIGMLDLDGLDTDDEENAALIHTVADALSTHIENLRLTQTTQMALAETELQANRLALLNELSAQLSSADSLAAIMYITLSQTPNILDAAEAGLSIPTADGEHIEIFILQNETVIQVQTADGSMMALAGTSAQTVLQERRPILTLDTRQSDKRDLQDMARFNVFSIIQAPLILGERVLGIINAVNPNRPGGFTDRDVNLLQQIATIVATTMENRRLFEQATKRANREFLINTINQKIQGATSVERALEIATREIGQQLKARKVTVEIGATSGNGHSAKQPEIN